jgi:lysophospholipase L1-like esterase
MIKALLFLVLAAGLQAEQPIRVACIGDSITAGTVLKDRDRTSYPAVLATLLGPAYDVKNFGRSGATVTALGEGALPYRELPEFQAALAWHPQVVILMLGTNDTKTAVFDAGSDTFETEYQRLVNQFLDLPTRPRVILCQPVPVIGEGRFTINEENRKKLLPIIAARSQADSLDLLTFEDLPSKYPDGLPDRVHPNAQVTEDLAKAIGAHLQSSAQSLDPR